MEINTGIASREAGKRLCHATRQEAADGNPARAFDRPDHRSTSAIGLRDNGIIRDHNPFALDPDTVMAFLGFPIGIRDGKTVRIRATQSIAALQRIEPWLQRRPGVPAVVASATGVSCPKNGQNHRDPNLPEIQVMHVRHPVLRTRFLARVTNRMFG